jgi:pimeloyl-ACP methyl ester carboxylesterase
MEERLVFFPCGETSLAGILTVPVEPNGRTVLIPWGAGAFPSSGRNRIRTRMARAFADHGFHTFRFDYRGVGESDGDYLQMVMAKPKTHEIIAACAWLTSQGLARIVVVGNCFGGWSSLMAAPMIPGLEGMAVVNAPVWRDHKQVRGSWRRWPTKLKRLRLSKLRSPKHRAFYRRQVAAGASSLVGLGSKEGQFSRAIGYLLEHHIPVLLMYGDDDFRADLESELDGGLRALVENAAPPTRLVTVSERLGLSSLGAQDLLLDKLVPWLHEVPKSSPSKSGAGG